MTNSTHTPGPWSLEFENKWPWGMTIEPKILHITRIAYSTADKSIDDVRGARSFDYAEREEVSNMVAAQEANAHLIAAAPDLLDALLEIRDDCVARSSPNGVVPIGRSAWYMLETAIAKARGDT